MPDEIEIQVDTQPDVEVAVADKNDAAVVPAAPLVKQADDPQVAADDLRRQIDAERTERERLARENADKDRRLAEANQRTEALQRETQDSHLHVITTALDAANKEALAIRKDLAAAFASGDYDKAAELQEKQAENRARAQQLQMGREDLEARLRRPKVETHEGRVQPAQPQTPEAQFNAYVSRFTQPTADYMRKHPEIVTDQRMSKLAEAAHLEATANGIGVDTPEYFAFVDKKFGWDKPEVRAAAPVQQQRRQAAAPPSREAPAMRAGSVSTSVKLSAEEQDIAKAMGMSLEDYARQKLSLIKEGKLSA